MEDDEFGEGDFDLAVDGMDEEFDVEAIAAQQLSSTSAVAAFGSVVKTEMDEADLETTYPTPHAASAPPVMVPARTVAPPPRLPTKPGHPTPAPALAPTPAVATVPPRPIPPPVPATRPPQYPAPSLTGQSQKPTVPQQSSVSAISPVARMQQTTIQPLRQQHLVVQNSQPRAQVPSTPVKEGRVDSSLFATPSSTLKKVDRDPSESPLKRTKVVQEDDAAFNLGSARPDLTPAGRPRIPGPAGDMSMSTAGKKKKSGLLSITIKNSQDKTRQSAEATPIVTRGMETVVSPTDPAQDADFFHGPWLTMLEHLQLPPFLPPEGNALRLLHSIEDVQRDGWRTKVPQLIVVIKSIATDSNASVTLKDPTGEIQGTIHHSALDNHPNMIKKGAVLLLRQVSVFTPVPGSHYLNITDNNVVHIFHRELSLPKTLSGTWRHTYSPLDAYQAKRAQAYSRTGPGRSNPADVRITGRTPTGAPGLLAPPAAQRAVTTPYATPKPPTGALPSQAPGRGAHQSQRPGNPARPPFPPPSQKVAPVGSQQRTPSGAQRTQPPGPAPVRREALPGAMSQATTEPVDDGMDLIYAELDMESLLGASQRQP